MDFQKLFNYMSKQHDLTLVESEMFDIIEICKDILEEYRKVYVKEVQGKASSKEVKRLKKEIELKEKER